VAAPVCDCAPQRRVEKANTPRTGTDEIGIVSECVLQPGKTAINHGFDSGFEFEKWAFLRNGINAVGE